MLWEGCYRLNRVFLQLSMLRLTANNLWNTVPFWCLLTFLSLVAHRQVKAQGKEYVLSGTVYGQNTAETEKNVYIVAYEVLEQEAGVNVYAVPSPQHSLFTKYDGEFNLVLNAEKAYLIEFAKKGYRPHKLNFSPKKGVEGKEVRIEVNLQKGTSLIFSTQYVDANTKEPIFGAQVTVLSDAEKILKTGMTNREGISYFIFEETESYITLQAHKSGYFWEEKEDILISSMRLKGNGMQSRELVPIKIGQWIGLPPFDFGINDDMLQPKGKEALIPLFELMRDNQGLRVEVACHTDARGDDTYNKLLSQKRAEAAVDFLIDLGISPVRLRAVGYGEEKIINECSNGVRCDNDRHKENRRVEYMVYEIVE